MHIKYLSRILNFIDLRPKASTIFALLVFVAAGVAAQSASSQSNNPDPASLERDYTKEIGHPADGIMRDEPSGLRVAYLSPIFPSSHAANLLALRNGDLLCFWFSGSWEGQSGVSIVMSRLAKNASGWTTPVVIDQRSGASYQNPVGFQAPDGTVWLLHTTQPADQGESDARVLFLRSNDDGKSWSPSATLINIPGAFVRNPLLVMPDGAWMLPMYYSTAGSNVKEADHPVVAISTDHGSTWKDCEIPGANELVQPDVVYDSAQGYMALLRSRRADFIYRSTSKDGCHWSTPVATSLPNNNSSIQTLRLPDGILLLAFNNTSAEMIDGKRRTGARKPLSLAVSSDFGVAWHSIRNLESGRTGVTDMSNSPGREEYSYPALCLGADGRIYAAYTFRRETMKVISFPEKWLIGQQIATNK